MTAPITATFPSLCTCCGDGIDPGQRIIRDDEYHGWMHTDCADEQNDDAVCPSCHLVHAPAQQGCEW